MTARRRAAPTAPRSEHGGPGLAGARRPGPDLPRGLRLLLGSVLLLALLAGLLGNDVSALLVGLLHDTRTPRQMADDLVMAQKEATPDLAVVQQEETSAGSVLMFLQYTIHPQSATAMLLDEKALVGTLEPGTSTITLRGMVPDRADVEGQFDQIEHIIGTLSPAR